MKDKKTLKEEDYKILKEMFNSPVEIAIMLAMKDGVTLKSFTTEEIQDSVAKLFSLNPFLVNKYRLKKMIKKGFILAETRRNSRKFILTDRGANIAAKIESILDLLRGSRGTSRGH